MRVSIIKSGLFLVLSLQIILLPSVFAEPYNPSYQYFSSAQCSTRAELYDPEVMANTMANPKRFKEFMLAMSQAETMQIMMSCASNPDQWSAWMSKASDPNKMMRTMMVFMNPQFYFNWMTAFMNPAFYNSK